MQYEYLGIPAVCPHFAAGKVSSRQGYEPGNPDSIAAAVAAAMAVKTRAERGRLLSWNEVAKRLLSPSDFADCELGSRTSGQTTDTTEVAPILSLILSTLGRTTELVRLFESLKAQGDIDYEVILVDQNPVGYLDFIIESYEALLPIRHTRSPKGLSVGRNIGLQHARGRLICFPDDDCWYPPTTLKDVVTFFSRYPDIDVVLGKTVDVNGDDSLSPFRKSSGTVSKDNLWISGNSNTIFLRHTAASRIGPFDESLGVGSTTPFQSGEETDFILRALSMGMRAIFLNSLLIHHDQVDREIGDKQIRRAWNYSKGFGRVLRIHGYGRLYLVYRVLRSAGRALVSLLSLDGLQAKYKFVWAAGTLVGYSHRLEKVGADEVEGSRL
jgi:glycosyltransferase involved in cell wall biosynthesis